MPAPLAAGDGWTFYAGTSLLPALVLALTLPLGLLAGARAPDGVRRILAHSRRMPWRSFGAGVLLALAFLLLGAAASRRPLFVPPFLAAGLLIGVLAPFGLAAEARALGAELRGRDPLGPWEGARPTGLGWLVLAGVPLAPVAGPLVLLFLLLRSAGAALLAFVLRE